MKLQELGTASLFVFLAVAYLIFQIFALIEETLLGGSQRKTQKILFTFDPYKQYLIVLPRPVTKLQRELVEWSKIAGFGLSIDGSFRKKLRHKLSIAELAPIILSLKLFLEQKGYTVEAHMKDLFQATPFAEVLIKERTLSKLKNRIISMLTSKK